MGTPMGTLGPRSAPDSRPPAPAFVQVAGGFVLQSGRPESNRHHQFGRLIVLRSEYPNGAYFVLTKWTGLDYT